MTETQVLIDALPYTDKGYEDEQVRESAARLIEEEVKRYHSTKNYLEHVPGNLHEKWETPVMRTMFERLDARQPNEMLSMKRCELPQPPPGQKHDVSAWLSAVSNSRAQLEHQDVRLGNLELLKEFGCNSWTLHLQQLQKLSESQQAKLHALRQNIQDTNWARKREHTEAGNLLHKLEGEWLELVGKNYAVERACAELETEVEKMEGQKRDHIQKSELTQKSESATPAS